MSRLAFLPLAVALLLSAAAAAAAGGAGEHRVLVVLATWGPKPISQAEVRRAVFEDADAFIRRVSRGKSRLAGDVTPWLDAFAKKPPCDTRVIARDAREAARKAGYDLARYDGFIYLHGRNACPFAGLGTGNEVWLNGTADGELVVHEIGHTFTLPHANRWECSGGSCTSIEYGDPYSTMGNGSGGYNAWELHQLGWLPNVTRVARPGRYRIEALERVSDQPQALVVTTARSEYWLELRVEPARARDGVAPPAGVLIHAGPNPGADPSKVVFTGDDQLLPDPAGKGRPTLRAGDSFAEPGAFRLKVVAIDGDLATLELEWTDRVPPKRPPIEEVLVGPRTVDVSWWDAPELGSGVAFFEVRVDRGAPRRVVPDWRVSPTAGFKRPAQGTHTASIVAVDRAGNRGPAAVRRFTVR